MPEEKSRELTAAEPVDPQERRRTYNRVVREAQLVTILLSDIRLTVNRKVDAERSSAHKLGFGGKMVAFEFNEEEKACLARVEWLVEIKIGRRTLAKCSAVYDVMYEGFETSDAEIVRLFADNVAQPAT